MRLTLTRLVDYALWGLLALALLRTTVLVRRRDTSEFAAVDFSATFAVVIIVAIIGLLVVHPRSRTALMRLRESFAIYLLIYFLYAAASALWSANGAYTLFRAGEVLAIFAAMFVLMEGIEDWRQAERVMLRVLMAVTVLGFLQRVITAGISVAGLHTNVYTVTAGMGFLYALGESLRADPARRTILRRWAAAFLVFAVVGTSAGSNIGIAVGMLILLPFLSRSKVVIIPAGLACIALIIIMGTSEEIVSTTLLSGRTIDEVQTLTGRMFLWTAYWNAFLESPLIGRGFAIVARLGDQFGTVATTNAHNGFIEAGAGLGIIGFGLLVFVAIRMLAEALRANRAYIAGGLGVFVALVMMLVNNNSKSILGGAYDPTIIGVFAMLAFFHVFTLRATRAQEASRRLVAADASGQASGATPARS